jgi:hypothetical protein
VVPARLSEREEEEFADGEPRGTAKPMRKGASLGLILGLIGGGAVLFLVLVGGGVALLVYFAMNRTIPEADWQTFSPPGSGCTLLMPGTPLAKPYTINDIAIDKYVVERKRERIVFGFAFLTLGANPLKANTLQAVFDIGRDELLRRFNGTMTSERAITLGDVPGREIDVLASDGSRYIARIYCAKIGGANRFYEVSVGGYAAARDKSDVVRFFDSLRMDASATPPTILGGPVAQGPQPPIANRPVVNPPRRNPVPPVRPQPRPRLKKQRPNPPVAAGERAVWSETSGTQTLSLAFSPDNATLAVGHWDKKLRLWDVAGNKDRQVIPLDGSVMAAAFSGNGKRLACGTDNGDLSTAIVPIWDIADVNAPKELQRIQLKHTRDKARVKALCFTPDVKGLAIALVPDSHSGSQVVLWDLENNKERAALRDCKGDVKKLSFTPDGAILILLDHSVRVWDAAANQVRLEFKAKNPAEEFITSALSPDGQTVATLGDDKKLKLWRLSDGSNLQTWPTKADVIRQMWFPLELSPDGKYLALGGRGPNLYLWDAKTGKELKVKKVEGSSGFIDVLAFSPDGSLLACHSTNGPRIYEVAALVAGK